MNIDLSIEPRKVYTWAEFKKRKPSHSIALDGFVDSPTRRDPGGPYANFDHHSKVDRLATRSTSEQIHIEIKLGLFDTFTKNGVPEAHVYVNDADEDTCLAWWLLKNHDHVRNVTDERLNRLVYCEDRLDSTAGAYPFGDTSMRRRIAWIFQPYYEARFDGRLPQMQESGLRNLIVSVESRITGYILDGGSQLPLKGHYERLGGGTIWTLTRETGPASRIAMYDDGITAFAALIAEKPDGSFVYTLGRRSVWSPFDLRHLYSGLNEAEAHLVNDANKWGGSDTIGGSPRDTGSRLPPPLLEKIINDLLGRRGPH